jgi:ribonuclease VapC
MMSSYHLKRGKCGSFQERKRCVEHGQSYDDTSRKEPHSPRNLSQNDALRLSMTKYVLDASALLAFLGEEPGGDRVEAALPSALVSTVNLSEVIAKLLERGVPDDEVTAVVGYLDCEVVDFTVKSAWSTARLRPVTRAQGLSLGDRACLALAIERTLPVMTTDRAWASLTLGIEINVVR